MGWLGVAMDVANLGVQVNQMKKLEDLRHQSSETAAVEEMLAYLRDMIFSFVQMQREIVVQSERAPVAAAAAMRVLRKRLQASGISPKLFPALADKDYVLSTIQNIRTDETALISQLTEEQQAQAVEFANVYTEIPDYDYYLEYHEPVAQYREALPFYEKNKAKCEIGKSGLITLGVTAVVALLFALSSLGHGWPGMLKFVLFALVCGGSVWSIFRLKPVLPLREFNESKEIVTRAKTFVDMDRFESLERSLGTDYKCIQKRRDEVVAFFEDVFQNQQMRNMLGDSQCELQYETAG